MHIRPEESDAFLHYIKLNSALWAIEDAALGSPSGAGIVIVDLLSHDLHQSIRSLFIGKILQRHFRCVIVGLVGNLLFSRDLEFEYSKDEAMRLGRSYGINEFLDFEEARPVGSRVDGFLSADDTETAVAELRAAEDDALTDVVLGWRSPTGNKIGEHIYETTLRITRNPFLIDVRGKLEEVTREAHRLHNVIVDFGKRRRIEAFVSGHVSYTQWGMTADLVLRSGGRCIWFDCTGNFSAYLLDRPPAETENLSGMVRKIDSDLFEREFNDRQRLDPRFVRKVEALFSSDYFLRPFWWEPTKSPPVALVPALRKTALAKLGWTSRQQPVICIFIHCLSDLPRDDEQIYLDYYVWVVETLQIAARNTSRLWIFKTHPANRGTYDVTNATERLKAEFAHFPHIFFVEDELEKVEVFALTDLAVTVRGSIAYEMSTFGKPALLAGRSVLSDLGFCHVARSEAEYERLLTTDPTELALTPEMRERAIFYLMYDKVACRIESKFLPYWTYRLSGDSNIWYALCERILYNISDMDPVIPALEGLLQGKTARTINPGYRELPPAPVGVALPTAAEDAPLAAGAVLDFGLDRNGVPRLLTQATRIDQQGSWFAAGQDAFVGLVLGEPGSESRMPASLLFRVSNAEVDDSLMISANGVPLRQIPIRVDGTSVDFDALGLVAPLDGNALALRFWVADAAGARRAFRLDAITLVAAPDTSVVKPAGVGLMGRLLRRWEPRA